MSKLEGQKALEAARNETGEDAKVNQKNLQAIAEFLEVIAEELVKLREMVEKSWEESDQ